MASATLTDASGASRGEVLELYRSLSSRGPAELLGVAADADQATARAAFLALARRFHPDVVAAQCADLREQAQEIFIALDQARRHFVVERGPAAVRRPATRGTAPDPAPRHEPAPRVEPPPAACGTRVPQASPAAASQPAESETGQVALAALARRRRVEEALEAATAAVARGEAETAVTLLHEVLSVADDEDRRRVRLLLARAYLADPRWRRYGLAQLREMAEAAPADVQALLVLAGFYRAQGLLARAESTLQLALASDPADAEVHRELQRVCAERSSRREEPTPARRAGLVHRLFAIAR